MWMMLLAKYWKAIIGTILVLSLAIWIGILRHQLNDVKDYNTYLQSEKKVCQMANDALTGQIQRQNEAVLALQTLADARQKKLDELLSQPPKIIYRDRISEVPIIQTGPCEEVMDALADYFGELTHVQ